MGLNKADVTIGGLPLWQRQIETLRAVGAEKIMVSGPAREDWKAAGLTVIEDEVAQAGPLGGLVSTLRQSEHPLLLVLAVDLPAMTSEFLQTLRASVDGLIGVVPRIGERYEPLVAVYPVGALALAEECLARNDRSMQAFVLQAIAKNLVQARPVAMEQWPLFFNVNTPADLWRFK